jgi:predicted RNA-binding Zn-ribbon protein involved in translation (DUF1610 family)
MIDQTDDKALCPDCGAEFDPTKPIIFHGTVITGLKVFQCPNCGHLILLVVSADDESEAVQDD